MTKYLKGQGRFHPLSWAGILKTYKGLIPPLPDHTQILVAKVPHPPAMQSSWPLPRKSLYAATWYHATMRHYYPKAAAFQHVQIAEDVLRDPNGPLLVAAIPHLEELEIPVPSWVAFSVEVWNNHTLKKANDDWVSSYFNPSTKVKQRKLDPRWPLPAKWVLDRQRMSLRSDWARWVENRWKGGTVLINEHHKELLRRYSCLRSALLDAEDLDRHKVIVLVQHWLSKQTYDGLKYLANVQATHENERMQQALRRGDWLWT